MPDTTIDLGTWEITPDAVREYLSAVGNDLPVYRASGKAPALMLAARVVGRLLERLSLPDGAIHSLQDVETMRAPRIGSRVSAVAQVEPVRERSGMRFLTVSYTVADGDSPVLRGRATLLLPAAADSRGC